MHSAQDMHQIQACKQGVRKSKGVDKEIVHEDAALKHAIILACDTRANYLCTGILIVRPISHVDIHLRGRLGCCSTSCSSGQRDGRLEMQLLSGPMYAGLVGRWRCHASSRCRCLHIHWDRPLAVITDDLHPAPPCLREHWRSAIGCPSRCPARPEQSAGAASNSWPMS